MVHLPPPGIPHIYLKAPSARPFYNAPVFGPWLRKIGQVEAMLAETCAADPWLWVEGFFYNLPTLAWSLMSPDLNDHYTNRYGSFHGTDSKGAFSLEGYIEGSYSKDSIPGWARVGFKLGSLAQRIGWYFLIIDATSDFIVNWTSTVYQWAGCNPLMGRWMKCYAETGPVAGGLTPGRILWGANLEGDGQLLGPGGSGVIITQDMNAGVGFSLAVGPWSTAPWPVGTVNAWMIDSSGDTVMSADEAIPDNTGHATVHAFKHFARTAAPWKEFQVLYHCTGGYADVTGSSIYVSDGPSFAFGPGIGSNTPAPTPWPY